jgi:hypothetical protein
MAAKIVDPKASMGSSGQASGAAAGAMQGAAVGSMIAPGVGTAIGAVVGGVAGYLSGSGLDKASYHRKLAYKYRRQSLELQAAAQRRDILRQFRLQRANAILGITQEEGGTRSSSPMAGLSSIANQYAGAETYTQAGVYLQRNYDTQMNKAGKAAARANTNFALMDAAFKAAGSLFGEGGPFASSTTAPTSTPSASSAGSSSLYNWGLSVPSSPSYGNTTPYSPSFGKP